MKDQLLFEDSFTFDWPDPTRGEVVEALDNFATERLGDMGHDVTGLKPYEVHPANQSRVDYVGLRTDKGVMYQVRAVEWVEYSDTVTALLEFYQISDLDEEEAEEEQEL